MKRLCIDMDGVICTIKTPDETYADVKPIPGALEKINRLYDEGNYIIIQTARHMKTCEGNVGMVHRKIAKITLDWLEEHGFKYHEIYFGKPWANIYIDDNAFRLNDWNTQIEDIENILQK